MTLHTSNKLVLDQAAEEIRSGNLRHGEELLRQVLAAEPDNVLALLWLTKCTQVPEQRAAFFERVLSIDPSNSHALKGRRLYRKYLNKTDRTDISDRLPTDAETAAEIEQPVPPSRSLVKIFAAVSAGIIAIMLVAVIARNVLQSNIGASANDANEDDPVEALRLKALAMPNETGCKKYAFVDISFDVRSTNSLISPYVGNVVGSFKEGSDSYFYFAFNVTLAYQDGSWVTTGIDAATVPSIGHPLEMRDWMQNDIIRCLQ